MTDSDSRKTWDSTDTDGNKNAKTRANRGTISRRPLLKLLGVAAVPVASQGVQASDDGSESGEYGENGYGEGGYGGEPGGDDGTETDDDGTETGDDDETETDETPVIRECDIEEDSPPNPHATLYVDWTVSAPAGDLERVRLEVFDGSGSSVDSESIAVSGSSESSSTSFDIKHGSGTVYRVELEVRTASSSVVKERLVQA